MSLQALVLSDCSAKLVLSMEGILAGFTLSEGTQLLLMDVQGRVNAPASDALELPTVTSDRCVVCSITTVKRAFGGQHAVIAMRCRLCYMYYTSGSTGKPKGVLVRALALSPEP